MIRLGLKKIQKSDFVDNQRESRLCSLYFTNSSTVSPANCRKNTKSDSCQNWWWGYFRMKQSSRNTESRNVQHRVLCKWHKQKSRRLSTSLRFHKSHAVRRTMWNLLHERLATSLSLTCKEVRLICSEGLKRCFEGFISPRNCLWIELNPNLSSTLTWCSTRNNASKTVND